MPAEHEPDELDRWLDQQVQPLAPPPGTFELVTKRARRRKLRRALVSAAGAAAVVAAAVIAVPLSSTLHLTTTNTNAGLTAGSAATPRQTPTPGKNASAASTAPSSAPATSASAAPSQGNTGYLPPDYVPSSVTWDSTSTGWVMGPAGTPGQCANADPDICTSIARTNDGGQTWQGLPAPNAGDAGFMPGDVTGLRFLNSTYGWAFGPALWATDDGGEDWHQVSTGGASVTDLETVNGRAYALFENCTYPGGDANPDCTVGTLKTATAGSDVWTPVGGVPSGFSMGADGHGSAIIELAGATGTQPATGYLVAPDGTLYAGPLDGTAWHKAATLPCTPGPANSGLPQGLFLAPAGATSAGAARLALLCADIPTGTTSVYLSTDSGASWVRQTQVASTPRTSVPQSLTALPDGTLILAAIPGGGDPASGGIYLLPPGATQWQPATIADPADAKDSGFTYVGMTSASQGVALGGDPDLHGIWMTMNGGRTWSLRPIKA
jgi:hypothetical protein